MRSLVKVWDNRGELRIGGRYNGWTRRVRLYEGDGSIRINFEDETGSQNRVYDRATEAERDWAAFKNGELTVQHIFEGTTRGP